MEDCFTELMTGGGAGALLGLIIAAKAIGMLSSRLLGWSAGITIFVGMTLALGLAHAKFSGCL